MPPQPKHPSARRRKNRAATAAELVPVSGPVSVPELPERHTIVESKDENGNTVKQRVAAEWHPQAQQTWTEIWSSEMVEEYLEADYGLIRALLIAEQDLADRSERGRAIAQAVEAVAKIRKELGLTPMGRRSLDWVIAETDKSRAQTRRIAPPVAVDATCEELPPTAGSDDDLTALYE